MRIVADATVGSLGIAQVRDTESDVVQGPELLTHADGEVPQQRFDDAIGLLLRVKTGLPIFHSSIQSVAATAADRIRNARVTPAMALRQAIASEAERSLVLEADLVDRLVRILRDMPLEARQALIHYYQVGATDRNRSGPDDLALGALRAQVRTTVRG